MRTMPQKRDGKQKLSTMPLKRDGEQKLSTMPQVGDAEQRQMFEHTQHSNSIEPESFLFNDEEILLQSQGSYSKSRGGPWKVGSLCLTDNRLVFYQHSGLVFQTAVTNIMDVGVRKGRFVLGVKKPLLFLLYKSEIDTTLLSEREKTFLVWFAMNEPAIWEEEIRKAVVFGRMKKE
ncbi:MAG: hypothetical protein KAT65_13130 [Methanophagales archaeon]|nr:hypothetical protein [Methanophagales archaeon]